MELFGIKRLIKGQRSIIQGFLQRSKMTPPYPSSFLIYNISIYYMLSEVFWVAFVATGSAMIIKLASLCFQSKCKECVMCGGRIRIVRDTESEERQREFELTHPPPSPSPSSTANAVSLGASAL